MEVLRKYYSTLAAKMQDDCRKEQNNLKKQKNFKKAIDNGDFIWYNTQVVTNVARWYGSVGRARHW